MTDDIRFADVVEGVRATISAYTQALDDGRVDDVVATFLPDGTIELPGMGTHTGTDQLVAAYTGWRPRKPQRHLILNTVVTDWTATTASATSDLVFILLGSGGWSIQLVGRYHDVLHCTDGTWRFAHRRAEFVTPEAR